MISVHSASMSSSVGVMSSGSLSLGMDMMWGITPFWCREGCVNDILMCGVTALRCLLLLSSLLASVLSLNRTFLPCLLVNESVLAILVTLMSDAAWISDDFFRIPTIFGLDCSVVCLLELLSITSCFAICEDCVCLMGDWRGVRGGDGDDSRLSCNDVSDSSSDTVNVLLTGSNTLPSVAVGDSVMHSSDDCIVSVLAIDGTCSRQVSLGTVGGRSLAPINAQLTTVCAIACVPLFLQSLLSSRCCPLSTVLLSEGKDFSLLEEICSLKNSLVTVTLSFLDGCSINGDEVWCSLKFTRKKMGNG